MTGTATYTATACRIAENGAIEDVEIRLGERILHMPGPGGAQRELALLASLEAPSPDTAGGGRARNPAGSSPQTPADDSSPVRTRLPVLLGSGLGYALEALLERIPGPVAVVDKEETLLNLTRLRERFTDPRLLWVCDPNPENALAVLTRWQEAHGGSPFLPLINPFYSRLDRPWYGRLREHLEASASFDFWSKAVQPRFRSGPPRLLLLTSKYFLMGEVERACLKLNIPVRLLALENQEVGGAEFIRKLLATVLDFRPDCVLTLNHLGIDREGVLADLLTRLQLPLASWFVDNPHLILHLYSGLAGPWTSLFTWDADNLESLRELGYAHVRYLPLGTDPERFRPRPGERPPSPLLPAGVCFVGNSMVSKVAQRMKKTRLPAPLLRSYRNLAAAFGASEERSARSFILAAGGETAQVYTALPDDESRLAFETLLTWEATRQYRADCVRELMPFTPLLVGDTGWKSLFRRETRPWFLHPEVSYYDGLPLIYPFSDINFNCTSKQMKGAVNQRVFDVPAAGGFVLTDWREQMEHLFDPDREMVFYRTPQEIGELVRRYLKHPADRKRVAEAGRRRVLGEHTWAHRVRTLLADMRDVYGIKHCP